MDCLAQLHRQKVEAHFLEIGLENVRLLHRFLLLLRGLAGHCQDWMG